MTAATSGLAALLAAVLADPDDDGVRLVYSDWLEEHGEPERAEFVRAQVELARAPSVSDVCRAAPTPCHRCADCLRFFALRRRERELLVAHCQDWGPRYNRVTGRGNIYTPSDFRRGFVEHVTLPAAHWLSQADALRAACPLRGVTLTTWPGHAHGWRLSPGGLWVLPPEWTGDENGEAEVISLRRPFVRRALENRWEGVRFTLPPD